jgi:hypothetical protein
MYSLGTAAKATGLAKSTIHRAIKSGKISARSKDSSGYEIDPAELHRVYPLCPQSAPEPLPERSATPDPEVEHRLALALAEVSGLREILSIERQRLEDMQIERDRWHAATLQIADQSRRPAGWRFWR